MNNWTNKTLSQLLDVSIKDENLFAESAEESCIANLVQNPTETLEILTENEIDEKYFINPFYANTFKAVKSLVDSDTDFDTGTIHELIKGKDRLFDNTEIDVSVLLRGLADYPTSISPLQTNIDILIEKLQRREQLSENIENIKGVFNGGFQVKKKKAQSDSSLKSTYKHWRENPSSHIGVATRFRLLNAKISGLKGLVCIMGLPKEGKSTISMQIGFYAAQDGVNVIYCDFENGINEIMLRTLQAGKIVKAENPKELQEKAAALDDETVANLFDNFNIRGVQDVANPEALKAMIQKDKKTLVIVDSLQKLPALHENRRLSIDQWLYAFNSMKSENCTFLYISELNRGSYADHNSLSGGKETGGIEYTSDILLRLIPTKEIGIHKLTILASRNSGSGDVGLYGLTKYRFFVENPDKHSFQDMRREEETENTKILNYIEGLATERMDKRVYVDDLAERLKYSPTVLGRKLSELGYTTTKNRSKGEKFEKMYIKNA